MDSAAAFEVADVGTGGDEEVEDEVGFWWVASPLSSIKYPLLLEQQSWAAVPLPQQ